jgi:hypothetical protein
MAINRDFEEMFSALSDAGVEFLVVGGHAVMFYSEPRYTKDIDIWVRPTRANAERVIAALTAFGAPLADLSVEDLAVEGTVFQIGVEPNRIDVTTSIDGVEFARAWPSRVAASYGSAPIQILGKRDLQENKRATGRPQDLLDLERLSDD